MMRPFIKLASVAVFLVVMWALGRRLDENYSELAFIGRLAVALGVSWASHLLMDGIHQEIATRRRRKQQSDANG